MIFCCWWAPWEGEGRNGPDCSGCGLSRAHGKQQQMGTRTRGSLLCHTGMASTHGSRAGGEAGTGAEHPRRGILAPTWWHKKCRTKQRHFMANKAQIYCCNSLSRWQSGEESFCPLPILVEVGVDVQQGDLTSRQQSMHTPHRNVHALWYTVVESQKNRAAQEQKYRVSGIAIGNWAEIQAAACDGNCKGTWLRASNTCCASWPRRAGWVQISSN